MEQDYKEMEKKAMEAIEAEEALLEAEEAVFDMVADEHQDLKSSHVKRIVNNRHFKDYKEKKVPVSESLHTYYSEGRTKGGRIVCLTFKEKKFMSPQEIQKARRAERMYDTDTYIYTWAKAHFGKKNSRAHKKHLSKRYDNRSVDVDE